LVLGALLARLPAVGGVPLWAYVSVACLLVGGVACVPLVTGLVLGLWPRAWLARSAATMLAVERVQRMRHTATVVMAGVVASLSLCVALTVMVASFRGSVGAWLDVVLPADLYARTTRNGAGTDALHLNDAVLRDVAHVPGVLRVAGLRVSTLSLRADQPPIDLIARDLGVDARTGADAAPQRLPLVGVVAPHVPGHIEVYVSEAMVDLHGARVGQDLALPLLPGQAPVSVRVRGVWRDYARQQGAIVLALSDYQRLTGDHAINDLALWLAPSARTSEVEQAIRARVDAQGLSGAALTFAEPREIRTTTLRIFDRSFAVTYWLQAVAIGIGLFGTAASFSTQVLARRKEFGLLRHLGVARAQVLGIVGAEGLALSAVGAALGLALGMLVSVVLVKVVNPQSFHWTMDLLWPWPRLLALCGGVIVAGTLTALLAGRAAIGQDAVLAVKEDW
jgi:putative ABC transport system permease protein